MKRMLCVVLAALLLLFASVSLAATDDENKDKIMESLEKTVLSNHPAILKQVERILYMDALTVSDEQATELLALKLAQSDLTFVDKGTSLYDYTEQEQEIAIDYINRVCTILDISYTISPTNDKQSDNAVVISVYKDGKLLGKIDSDAKTDLADGPTIWYLVAGGACVLAAIALAIVLAARKRRANVTE